MLCNKILGEQDLKGRAREKREDPERIGTTALNTGSGSNNGGGSGNNGGSGGDNGAIGLLGGSPQALLGVGVAVLFSLVGSALTLA